MPKSTQWTACTAQRRDGSFCDGPTLPDAPFPICLRHAGEVLAFLRGRVDETVLDNGARLGRSIDLLDHVASPSRAFPPRVGRVYYVQVGPLIKIGFTERLTARINGYPPNSVLLAAEPGDYELESSRHEQFRHLLAERKEWFRPGLDLVAHINALRKASRQRPIGLPAA
jgi:hypothetical protein